MMSTVKKPQNGLKVRCLGYFWGKVGDGLLQVLQDKAALMLRSTKVAVIIIIMILSSIQTED